MRLTITRARTLRRAQEDVLSFMREHGACTDEFIALWWKGCVWSPQTAEHLVESRQALVELGLVHNTGRYERGDRVIWEAVERAGDPIG